MGSVFDGLANGYDRGMWFLEPCLLRSLRRRLYPYLRGRVLEIGVGTGVNLPLYAQGVTLIAVDLSEEMLRRARTRPTRARTSWVQADAQHLPFRSESMDHVVTSLVFCSVSDPVTALAEVRRVLRPGGWLAMVEHVRGEDGWLRWLTDVLERPWHRLSRGCHLNRETAQLVQSAGLRLVCTMRHGLGLFQVILARKDHR